MLLFWRTANFLALFLGPSALFLLHDFTTSGQARLLVGFHAAALFSFYLVFVVLRQSPDLYHSIHPESSGSELLGLTAELLLQGGGTEVEWWLRDALSTGMAVGLVGGLVSAFSVVIGQIFLFWAALYIVLLLFQGTLGNVGLVLPIDERHGHAAFGVVLLIAAWLVAVNSKFRQRGAVVNSACMALFGSYLTISALIMISGERTNPAPADPWGWVFFIHHSSERIDKEFDVRLLCKEIPWLLPTWLALITLSLLYQQIEHVLQAWDTFCQWVEGHVQDHNSNSIGTTLPTLPTLGHRVQRTLSFVEDSIPVDVSVGDLIGASDLHAAVEKHTKKEASDPSTGVAFLWAVMFLCLVTVGNVSFTIDWQHSYFPLALIYFGASGYLFWNVSEFFVATMAHLVVQFFLGQRTWYRANCADGLPPTSRTIVAYCLLSDALETSEEAWQNCLQAYMLNLDPCARMSACVVSVSNELSIVEAELKLRDEARSDLRRVLEAELKDAIPGNFSKIPAAREPFWRALRRRAQRRTRVPLDTALSEELGELMPQLEKNLLYLHRNTRVLKKPGQYQDLQVLTYIGSNEAITYASPEYGVWRRWEGQPCFGFEGNLLSSEPISDTEYLARVDTLMEIGMADVEYLMACGKSASERFAYSIVLDKDTRPEPRGLLTLAEIATAEEQRANANGTEIEHGILQPALRVDDEKDATWHMLLEAIRQTSSSNIPLTIFRLFGRYGFFGKGLFVHRIAVPKLILRELLPVDVLSHDTLEAKVMQPGYVHNVTFVESPARNAISAVIQSTRWMLGEVKNSATEAGSLYAYILIHLRHMWTLMSTGDPYPTPFSRNSLHVTFCNVSTGTRYLSSQTFRIMHAGPVILSVVLLRVWAVPRGLLIFRHGAMGASLLLFTVFTLFLFPRLLSLSSLLQTAVMHSFRNTFGEYDSVPQDKEMGTKADLELAHSLQNIALKGSHPVKVAPDEIIQTPSSDLPGFPPFSAVIPSPARSNAKPDDARNALLTQPTGSGMSTSENGHAEASHQQTQQLPNLGWKALALSILEGLLSLLVYSPECVVGVVRGSMAFSAFVTGVNSWKPQDAVEREIELRLGFRYVLSKTWYVPASGALLLICVFITHAKMNAWLAFMCFSWFLHPVIVYVGCCPVSPGERRGLIWRWVDEVREGNRQKDVTGRNPSKALGVCVSSLQGSAVG